MTPKVKESGSNAKVHLEPKNQGFPEVFLVHLPRVEHIQGDIHEQVTTPDLSPSIHQMISTGTVGSMPGNNSRYTYPDLSDDDDANHETEDYMKLHNMDVVEKEKFVENWLNKDENYAQVDQPEEKKEVLQKGEPEPGEGEPGHV